MSEEGMERDLQGRGLVPPDAEGDGLYDRYLLALVLLVVTIVMFAFTGDGRLGRFLTVLLESVTLLVILRSSRVTHHILVGGAVLVTVATASAGTALLVNDSLGHRGPAFIGALLALAGPPAIVRRLLTHHQIDITTVAGALCVYLLAGLLFAYVFYAIGAIDPPFFAQTSDPNGVDYIYFSFVTIATLGYGDLTPRGDLGRMLAATEAVLGQLYLVSAVALLVSNLGRTRTEAAPPPANRPPPRHLRRHAESSDPPDA
jgi:hypothetical protein